MIVAVDAAGGDYYPKNPVEGAIMALEADDHLQIILTGPEKLIQEELSNKDYDTERLHIHNAPEIIGMEESPMQAIKTKQQSSITLGIGLHKAGKCDAFVSAGNTGALLAASTFILGKLSGVIRPTIAAYYPTIKGVRLLVDAGANLEIKPDMAAQFAKMAHIFSRELLNISDAKVGLVNVGEEKGKGTDLHKEIYETLSELDYFIGNIEGKDILNAKADIFLCDGFTGNIILKFGESIPEVLMKMIKKAATDLGLESEDLQTVSKLLDTALHSFNYEHVGGIPFLGVNGVSCVGHGGSSPLAIKNMILNAVKMVENDVNKKIVASIN